MARVIRIFPLTNIESQEDCTKIKKILSNQEGIVSLFCDMETGVIEVEYENAIINRYIIRNILHSNGYNLLL
jgi:hypothetical protein